MDKQSSQAEYNLQQEVFKFRIYDVQQQPLTHFLFQNHYIYIYIYHKQIYTYLYIYIHSDMKLCIFHIKYICRKAKSKGTYFVIRIVLDDILYLAIRTIIDVGSTIVSRKSCKDGRSNWSQLQEHRKKNTC